MRGIFVVSKLPSDGMVPSAGLSSWQYALTHATSSSSGPTKRRVIVTRGCRARPRYTSARQVCQTGKRTSLGALVPTCGLVVAVGRDTVAAGPSGNSLPLMTCSCATAQILT
jgi:hypothetical protein